MGLASWALMDLILATFPSEGQAEVGELSFVLGVKLVAGIQNVFWRVGKEQRDHYQINRH
jgi:hypothetical protein